MTNKLGSSNPNRIPKTKKMNDVKYLELVKKLTRLKKKRKNER